MIPSGICFGCHRPTERASHAKWCVGCWPIAKRINSRLAYRRRRGIEVVPRACDDCGELTDRHAVARFCRACVKARTAARRRTPRYKAYQAKYRQSAKRKNGVAAWNERNRERLRQRSHENYLRRKAARGPKITRCATLRCDGSFVRPKSSHRLFCTDCQIAFYGRSYLRALMRRDPRRGQWTRKVA